MLTMHFKSQFFVINQISFFTNDLGFVKLLMFDLWLSHMRLIKQMSKMSWISSKPLPTTNCQQNIKPNAFYLKSSSVKS